MKANEITIVEMGPRDGLQNEKQLLTLAQKAEFIRLLEEAGHRRIEVGAFVNPQRVPQMAESQELYKQLTKKKNVRYAILLANQQGYDQAVAAGVNEIAFATAASNTFNQKNINTDIKGSLERFAQFAPAARRQKMFIRGYIATAFGCPFEGTVPVKSVVSVAKALLAMGCDELSIGDTIGVGVPKQVVAIVKALKKVAPLKRLAMHFHDTRGTGLANVYAALQEGVRIFDASTGGLGGCPFAPRSSGNIATDDLIYMLHTMGYKTGIDAAKQLRAALFMQGVIGRTLPSRYVQSQL